MTNRLRIWVHEARDPYMDAMDKELDDIVSQDKKATRSFSPKTVRIGSQVWAATNLDVDDGGEGIYVKDGETYYTWDAAMRVCSNLKGWHLPSKQEWETLFKNCGGKDVAGFALKSTSGWKEDGNGTDDFGFSALPAGYRGGPGYFSYHGYLAYFWSSAEYNSDDAYSMTLRYGGDYAYLSLNLKYLGFSVRCLRD